MVMDYSEFLRKKSQLGTFDGFDPIFMPDFLFDFQKSLVDWSLRKGKAAIFADCGLGKGQPPESKILTPDGWSEIGSLIPGDLVIASDGNPYPVMGVYPKMRQPVYDVCFSDGVSIRVDADHLHICRTNNDRQRGHAWRVMGTTDLILCNNLRYGVGGKSRNYDIPVVNPVMFFGYNQPIIDPYVIGVLLGDGYMSGNISISSADVDILNKVRNHLPDGITL
jgi:phosphate starvation-inducible protein PhoH and related proteins